MGKICYRPLIRPTLTLKLTASTPGEMRDGGAMNESIELWNDRHIFGGMDILKASCRTHRYDAHAHEYFVVAAFSGGAQKHRIAGKHGVAFPGSVMIIPPGEVHTGESAMRDIGWEYSAFYPSAATLDEVSMGLFGHSRGSLDFGTTFLIKDNELSARLLLAADFARRAMERMKRQEAVFDAFEMLIRRYGRRSGQSLTEPIAMAPIQIAIDYIMANLGRRLSIEEIAAKAELSEFHFMRLFKQHTRMTVHQYIINKRLEFAKIMLASGVSPASTALEFGFYDQSHFTAQFRRTFGLTPKSYAKLCR